NRADTPLLEIVSEPDMRSSDEAVEYLKKLHSIVRYIDISDANMQEGSFRCDVNISIRPKGSKEFGTRVEIKNINSFRFVKQAIEYEFERQVEAYEDGVYDKEVIQETRLFDVNKGITKSMRGKEDSADYRYFPDPDLLVVITPNELLEEAKDIPELPDEKVARYVNELKIKKDDALIITAQKELADFFEEVVKEGVNPQSGANWLNSELMGRLKKLSLDITSSLVSPKELAFLIKRVEDGTISGKGGKEILDYIFDNELKEIDIDSLIDKLGLKQLSDESAIEKLVDEVLSANEDKVQEYKNGKVKLFGFFVGQVMKASKGSANPAKVNEILKKRLES
ncbi:MAG: Asp-tRNA(Asn)/Glu-tRNA(Gln) amidotransferase subunit GatB, partial [Epsilonproteobacteria bacterium]|nr:Asp-tRNA(Asn)/Glu-tRNA(Gln) amidotransferase subunit GatB [Campylobacterota bacterium]